MIGSLLLAALEAHAYDQLFDNFDRYPTGSIAMQSGWTRFTLFVTRTAQVSTARSVTSSNSLEFAWTNAGLSSVSAAYTNFRALYHGTNHPVIRASAMLYLENRNANVSLNLVNTTPGGLLTFRCNTNDGRAYFGFNSNRDLGVALITGRFANVTFYYNMSDNTYAVDYNYTNVLPWTASDSGLTYTQFNAFALMRASDVPGSIGQVFIDDVRVETFPPATWAWWRFERTDRQAVEQTGRIGATNLDMLSMGSQVAGSSDPVFDGTADVQNPAAQNGIASSAGNVNSPTPSTTNWTAEVVFRTAPGENSATLLSWGQAFGFNTNGSWIELVYRGHLNNFACTLRDAEQANIAAEYLTNLGYLVPDDRWHHLACVKSNGVLKLFLDYQLMTSNTLDSSSNGSYRFGTNAHAAVGVALNRGNMSSVYTTIDEIRFSSRALIEREFLQPGQPLLVNIVNTPATPPWMVTLKGILGENYRVDVSDSLEPGAVWIEVTNRTADFTFNYLYLPTNTLNPCFVRVRRP